MKLCHPIRLLLPVAGTLIALPIAIPDKFNIYLLTPIFYFFGTLFICINFPRMGEIMHERPIYLEDLSLASGSQRDKFKNIYSGIMTVTLALLFALFSEYVLSQDIFRKPVVEILAVIGGNLMLYIKAQHFVGKILITMCHCIKEREEERVSGNRMPTITETNIDEAFGFNNLNHSEEE